MYAAQLAAPDTVNTMPEATLLGFADHGVVAATLDPDSRAGRELRVDHVSLAARLQAEGEDAFVHSWTELLTTIERKSNRLAA
jgi:transaldolase